jgi:hypothetical protein
MPTVLKPSAAAAALLQGAITTRFTAHPAFRELSRLRQDQADAPTRLRLVLSVYPNLVERMVSGGPGSAEPRDGMAQAVADGINLFGFRAMHATAMLTCVVHAFDGVTHHLDAMSFWRRAALAGATGSAVGATAGGSLDEDAAIAGLLVHIGWLAIDQSGAQYLERLEAVADGNPPTEEHEVEAFGFSIRELTATLLRAWEAPPQIAQAAVDASAGVEGSALAGVLLLGLAAADAILAGDELEPVVARSIEGRVGSTQALLTRVDALLSGVMLQ